MKEESAVQEAIYLKPLIGAKVFTINGGDFTVLDIYAGLQKGSENQFEVYLALAPKLVTVEGQVKTETFNLFKSTYSVLGAIEITVEVIEEVKRLCLFVPENIEYDSVQFFTVGNKQFPQKLIASFPVSKPGMKCHVFEISNDLKRHTRSESGRFWASVNPEGITYSSNALSFAKINAV